MDTSLAQDIAAIQRMPTVQKILEAVSKITGMGFSAVARVSETQWTACVVRDRIGFGLQQIASNFISGVILLLEGQATVGDFVELDGGEAGQIVKMTARATVLKTFDGRQIMVPNEHFITTRVTNYSDSGSPNRYEALFSVSYATDINLVPKIIIAAVSLSIAMRPSGLTWESPPGCSRILAP